MGKHTSYHNLTISFILINAFRFNQCHHFMYKYLCPCFNKSVLIWTFCQSLLHPKKNPLARKYLINRTYLQRIRQALHGDGSSESFSHVSSGVDGDRKCVPQCHGREQHLDADQEVLVSGGYRTCKKIKLLKLTAQGIIISDERHSKTCFGPSFQL